jgi:hypothetical protein
MIFPLILMLKSFEKKAGQVNFQQWVHIIFPRQQKHGFSSMIISAGYSRQLTKFLSYT